MVRHCRQLVALHAEYVAWHDALPESLRGSGTAEALQAIVDLDLDALIAIVLPRGRARLSRSKKWTGSMKFT
jgi:hypothetical protein